jgi:nicotinamide-nucleotide amidase
VSAEILAIGSELLDPERDETNGPYLATRLRECGIDVLARVVVADDPALLESAFRTALGRADVVIATGGLGPTADDLTREAAAAALGRPLRRDEHVLEALRKRFARLGRTMVKTNEQQADVIADAVVLPNPNGTAPGQRVEHEGRLLVLLPGPPGEMRPLFESQVLPLLRERTQGAVLRTRVLRIAGMPEGEIDQLVAPIYAAQTNPRTTILSAPGEIELHLTATAATPEAAEGLLEALAVRMRQALPGLIYSEDGRTLAEVVAGLLRERGLTLAVAESCTGGLLCGRLTSVPGASAFLERGFVTYSNRSKVEELGVDPAVLEAEGAVSEAVARAMAEGARRVAGTSIGVGITGIAGPDGGTPEKPVGLVFVAMAGAAGDAVRRLRLFSQRERVRNHSVQIALEMLRRGLLGLPAL